mmetsp:Transcript_22798/g.64992  ORF Transcript_22798/g.64992 Transcript_22798/m.64992 type:complete len:220 (-) Transcript_22798:714-1373(-)
MSLSEHPEAAGRRTRRGCRCRWRRVCARWRHTRLLRLKAAAAAAAARARRRRRHACTRRGRRSQARRRRACGVCGSEPRSCRRERAGGRRGGGSGTRLAWGSRRSRSRWRRCLGPRGSRDPSRGPAEIAAVLEGDSHLGRSTRPAAGSRSTAAFRPPRHRLRRRRSPEASGQRRPRAATFRRVERAGEQVDGAALHLHRRLHRHLLLLPRRHRLRRRPR